MYLGWKNRGAYYIWPPSWTTTGQDPEAKPFGEIGELEQVLMSQDINDLLYLVIRENGLKYMGAIAFDDPILCQKLGAFLKSHIGLSIKAIGDLELSIDSTG